MSGLLGLGNMRLGASGAPTTRLDTIGLALDKHAPILSVILAPLAVGYMAYKGDKAIDPPLASVFGLQDRGVVGTAMTFGARVAIGVGAGLLTSLILVGGGIAAGYDAIAATK
jgi:hypothetical protein